MPIPKVQTRLSYVSFLLKITIRPFVICFWYVFCFQPFLTFSTLVERGCYRFRDKWKVWKFWVLGNFQKCCVVIIDNALDVVPNHHPFRSISYHFRDKHFLHKNGKIGSFSKLRAHDLEVINPNYEKAHLLRNNGQYYCCKV